MIAVGIDIGLDGAIAVLGEDTAVYDMPVLQLRRGGKNKREVDAAQLADLLRPMTLDKDVHVFVESVGAMPGQGVSGMFSLGRTYGTVLGILAAHKLPVTLVAAAKWKKALGVPASKDGARFRASQLLPGASVHWPLKKHHGRSEAALIALWGWRHQVIDGVRHHDRT